jgi:hypothetical protein
MPTVDPKPSSADPKKLGPAPGKDD